MKTPFSLHQPRPPCSPICTFVNCKRNIYTCDIGPGPFASVDQSHKNPAAASIWSLQSRSNKRFREGAIASFPRAFILPVETRQKSPRLDEDWSDYAKATGNGCIMQILATCVLQTTKAPQMERCMGLLFSRPMAGEGDSAQRLRDDESAANYWSADPIWRMPNTQRSSLASSMRVGAERRKLPPKVIFKLAASLHPNILTLLKLLWGQYG